MTSLPGRRWWHLAWSLPIAGLVSLPVFSLTALSYAVSPSDFLSTTVGTAAIGALFFVAGLPVRQRTIGRRFAVAGGTAAAGVLLTVAALAVVA